MKDTILEQAETPKLEENIMEQKYLDHRTNPPLSDYNVAQNLDPLCGNDLGYAQRPTQLKLTHKIPDIAVFTQNESISTIDNNKEMSAQHSSIRQFENSRRSLKGLIKKNSRKLPN